jgi:SAM-dependent methyltransferase
MSDRFDYLEISCPTCEVDDTRVVGQRGGAAHRDGAGEECRVVECQRCGLIYANPFPVPKDLDELYSHSEGYFSHNPAKVERGQAATELVQRLESFTSGRRLLDVGAGLGDIVAAAYRRGWDAYGVETAIRFADSAEALVPGRIFHGELADAPPEIAGRTYDAIILAAVLEHFHHPMPVLAAVSRLLNPGGVLYIEVPNEAGLYFKAANAWLRLRRRNWVVNLAPTFPPFHVLGFSRRSLTAMLRRNALEPEQWLFYPGANMVPMRPSATGLVEWLGSRAMSFVARYGELGAYMECFARKSRSQ